MTALSLNKVEAIQEVLNLYADIFKKTGFNYIIEIKNIELVILIFQSRIPFPDKGDKKYIDFLDKYLKNANIFFDFAKSKKHPRVKKAHNLLVGVLEVGIKLLSETPEKRRLIRVSRGQKYIKTYLIALKELKQALHEVFTLDGGLSISFDIFTNYLIDEKIGLGKKYYFDKQVIKDIRNQNFSKGMLQSLLECLRTKSSIRNPPGGWAKYGMRKDPFRAWGSKKKIFGGPPKIYWLSRNNDESKKPYDDKVKAGTPDDYPFERAA